jgi:hypothetical protein
MFEVKHDYWFDRIEDIALFAPARVPFEVTARYSSWGTSLCGMVRGTRNKMTEWFVETVRSDPRLVGFVLPPTMKKRNNNYVEAKRQEGYDLENLRDPVRFGEELALALEKKGLYCCQSLPARKHL